MVSVNFVFEMMNFVLKMMNFVLQMMNFGVFSGRCNGSLGGRDRSPGIGFVRASPATAGQHGPPAAAPGPSAVTGDTDR